MVTTATQKARNTERKRLARKSIDLDGFSISSPQAGGPTGDKKDVRIL